MRSERKPELGPELSRGGGAGAARWAFAWGGFALVAFLIYWPALEGPFVSDDLHYVANNPYVRELSWLSVYETISPRGEVVRLVENYAPVHVLLHGIEWQLFEADVRGYHVVNVVLHVVAAVLLLRLLRRSGLSDAAALFGAAFFLVHPANVEAVAWISQLKTSSSLVLALAALLALPSRPLLATACFALAILAKPVAAFALPVFAILAWTQARGRDSEPVAPLTSGRWLAAWAIVFAAFTLVEFDAFLRATSPERAEGYELASRLPMAVALWGRYLAMAFTSHGVSAFHDRLVLSSALDPWFVGGALGAVLIGAKAILALRGGRAEAAWWIWAAVAFLPVSQILPFRYPMGDRYLYPILPGLIGGTLLATTGLLDRLRSRPLRLRQAAAVIAAVWIGALGVRSHERAELWRQPVLLIADAAAHYPDGIQAHLLRARSAAIDGDGAAAARELRAAMERGFTRFEQVLSDPVLGPFQADPEVARVLGEMAGYWVERYQGFEELSQAELLSLGVAHQMRGEHQAARRAFERALERGGPSDPQLRQVLRSYDFPRERGGGR